MLAVNIHHNFFHREFFIEILFIFYAFLFLAYNVPTFHNQDVRSRDEVEAGSYRVECPACMDMKVLEGKDKDMMDTEDKVGLENGFEGIN